MKAKTYTLCKDLVLRQNVISNIVRTIIELECENNYDVVIKNHDSSKSSAQRRTNWMWNNEVSKSGIGQNDSADGVHLDAKWRFARPLLLAGDDPYSLWVQDLIKMLEEHYPGDTERLKNLFVHGIHTEQMETSMVAEFLTNFQNYWTSKGVNLTDPDLRGMEDATGI